MSLAHRIGISVFLCAVPIGCQPGAPAESVRPEAPTASQALGEEQQQCTAVAQSATPLIVDLDTQGRLDLEVAMKDGLPVVKYNCDGLTILTGCRVVGDLKFAGVSLKEDIIQLTSKDEVRANLPISGASLAGSLERGTSLDLAMAYIGKQTALIDTVSKDALTGECDGATHFVRAATLGAFALTRGSGAEVTAAVEIFGAGTSGSSESRKKTVLRDGALDACKKSDPDAEGPPAQCRSALRVELRPFASGGESEASSDEPTAIADPCPEGFTLSAGKCTTDKSKKAFLCSPEDESACRAQCAQKHPGSCYNLGLLLSGSPEASKAFDTACDGGVAAACFYAASFFLSGTAGKPKDPAKARALNERGCSLGDGNTCLQLASTLESANKTDPDVTKFARRGCDLGVKASCFMAIRKLLKGEGVAKDPAAAQAILKRTCEAGEGKRCGELGMLMLSGHLPDKDQTKALGYIARGCDLGRDDVCRMAALAYTGQMGVTADKAKAKSFFDRACPPPKASEKSCVELKKKLKL